MRLSSIIGIPALVMFLATCGGPSGGTKEPSGGSPATAAQRIKHVIVIMQENRSFDHYFGTFPGAEDVFLGGQRIDPRSDGRVDPRPTVREQVQQGDLMNDFDFSQAPLPPLVLQP
jgi:phospholipase C